MTDTNQKQLNQALWSIADQLRGARDANDFRDYPDVGGDTRKVPLQRRYANNPDLFPAPAPAVALTP